MEVCLKSNVKIQDIGGCYLVKLKNGCCNLDGLGKWEIFIIIAYIVMQIIGRISEHCPKRHCLKEKERKILQEKINELDGI